MPQVEQVPVAIMFDIDSTLIFVDGAGITAWAHAFRRLHDIDADIEAFTEHVMTDPEVARLTFIGAVGRPATARELTRLLGAYQKMAMHVDPVCGIHVTAGTAAAIREHLGRKYFLCSAACDSRFTPDPAFYLHQHRKYTNFRPVRGRLTYRAPRGRRRNCILPSSPPSGMTT